MNPNLLLIAALLGAYAQLPPADQQAVAPATIKAITDLLPTSAPGSAPAARPR